MAENAADALRRLADDYWEGVLERNPTLATYYGDFRYNERLPDPGPRGRAAEQAALDEVMQRLARIPLGELETEDRITHDMLRLAAEHGLAALRLRLYEWDVDQMAGPQVWLLELLNWHPLDTAVHQDQLVARYRAFPTYLADYLDNLRAGLASGRVAFRGAVDRVIDQLTRLLATPVEETALIQPLAQAAEPQRRAAIAAVEEAVFPAYRRMLDFLRDEYRARAREEAGVWSITDGDVTYAELARRHTTTDLTPDALHRIGREELEGIQAEMRAIAARLGHTEDLSAFAASLKADPRNFLETPEALLAEFNRILAKLEAALPRAFGRLPRARCVVRAIEAYREKDSVAAFYYPPAADGSRPGIFYANTYQPRTRPRYNFEALTAHEAVPGHHLQIALAQETEGLPAFRRLGYEATAFVEGWGLYSERLADELGLYSGDLDRFGMLGYQAWRAARLVVDTGMHALRWSRRQAIEFMVENVGLTEEEVVNEIDRYIIWPGQALAYMIGQREFQRLRREAMARLGARFDLRAFHDEALGHSALPLSTLAMVMDAWRGA